MILQVLQKIQPKSNNQLLKILSDFKSSNMEFIRIAAARTLSVFLTPETAISFLKESLEQLKTADSNVADGILQQYMYLVKDFPPVVHELIIPAMKLCQY
jgi:hypothetical protein